MKLKVVVHPNSRRPRIEKDLFGSVHVYVHAPPLDGRANRAVIDSLAKYYEVKRSAVVLLTGTRSKHKQFEIGNI